MISDIKSIHKVCRMTYISVFSIMKSVIAAVALGGVYGKDKNTQALGGTTYHPFSSRRRMGSQHGAQAFPSTTSPAGNSTPPGRCVQCDPQQLQFER